MADPDRGRDVSQSDGHTLGKAFSRKELFLPTKRGEGGPVSFVPTNDPSRSVLRFPLFELDADTVHG